MKINLDRNFTKYVGSKPKAISLLNKIAAKYNDRVYSYTVRKSRRRILEVYGNLKNLNWKYDPYYKTLSVFYTDGRPDAEEVDPKNVYYMIWIEGMDARGGEKVRNFTASGILYTTKITEAMRVREKDLERIKDKLRYERIADWVIDNPRTFVKTHYAPKGTFFYTT